MKIFRFSPFSKSLILSAIAALGIAATSCGNDNEPVAPSHAPTPEKPDDPTHPTSDFARGADVSWLSELEDNGCKFYSNTGTPVECMELLKTECGIDAIRLRVWVNPANKYNSIADVMVKARRAAALGLRLMIDFHLSDNWADPGKQVVPAAWAGMTAAQMADAIKNHVNEMLSALKAENITPEWVQIGNETTPGMLHPMGEVKGDSAGEFPRFLNAGYDAVKAIFPDAQVIVHLDCGNNADTYRWFFDLMQKTNARYDMIGMSLYPIIEQGSGASWTVTTDNKAINDCIANIKALNTRYKKPVMICEIGFHHTQGADCSATLTKLMNEFSDGTILKGIFYWEPEAEPDNTGYHKGCFSNGRPTSALAPFKNL